ncbi:MAG: helix-turn-helix transcriptional regulator [Verrucomicrobiota bacterium]
MKSNFKDNKITLRTSPRSILQIFSARSKEERLRRGWRLQDLADRSGIKLGTLKHFEKTGEISLERFLLILSSMGRTLEIESLLLPPEIQKIEEIDSSKRQRGMRGGAP